jgi:hypothetical protein
MSSIEDRVWSDLVSDHAAKLAEVTWSTATPHPRRPVLLAGSAVVVARVGAALVLIPTGTTSPPAYAGPARRVPASSLADTLNMNAVVAEATIGNATFVVAPAVKPPGIMGRLFVPDELCFAVSGRLSGSGGASGMLTCGSRTSVETKGSGAAVTDGATGITTVWGFAP